MTTISARWADRHLAEYGERIEQVRARFPKALPQTINQVGDRSKTVVIRELARQTGLKRAVIVRAIGDPRRASGRRLSYEMTTRGGLIRLKYLEPRETRKGVSAKPWGRRRLFEGTFMRGGRFPNRGEVAKLGGHVWRRLDTAGRKITQVRSGMTIPEEMTSGATAAAFDRIAGPLLAERVGRLLAKLAP